METSLSSSSSSSSKRISGRKRIRETRHPTYHGVRQRKGGKWVCEVREPLKKNRIWLGTFPTPVMAARAHDVASIALRGDQDPARLNFPDSAWALPRPASGSAEDIRRAAYKAAEMYREGGGGVVRWELGLDDEAVFNMPGLVDSMAEGMMLTPPAMKRGFDWNDDDGSYTASSEECLWFLD